MKQKESGDSNVALKFRGWGGCHPRPVSRDFKERKLQRRCLSPLKYFLWPFSSAAHTYHGFTCQFCVSPTSMEQMPPGLTFCLFSQAPFLLTVSLAMLASVPGEMSRLSHTQPRRAEGKRPPGERLPGLCRSQTWVTSPVAHGHLEVLRRDPLLPSFLFLSSSLVSFLQTSRSHT